MHIYTYIYMGLSKNRVYLLWWGKWWLPNGFRGTIFWEKPIYVHTYLHIYIYRYHVLGTGSQCDLSHLHGCDGPPRTSSGWAKIGKLGLQPEGVEVDGDTYVHYKVCICIYMYIYILLYYIISYHIMWYYMILHYKIFCFLLLYYFTFYYIIL